MLSSFKRPKPKELEDIYETSFKSICNCVNKLHKGEIEALVDKEKTSCNPRLSLVKKAEIKDLVYNKSPEEYQYNSSTCTRLLPIDWIKKQYNIKYNKAQICNILKSLNIAFQKGKGGYPEAIDWNEKVAV